MTWADLSSQFVDLRRRHAGWRTFGNSWKRDGFMMNWRMFGTKSNESLLAEETACRPDHQPLALLLLNSTQKVFAMQQFDFETQAQQLFPVVCSMPSEHKIAEPFRSLVQRACRPATLASVANTKPLKLKEESY